MISIPDYRKNIRFEHKSFIMLADKHSGYFASAQMFNFSGGGLYFESDVDFNVGTNIQILSRCSSKKEMTMVEYFTSIFSGAPFNN